MGALLGALPLASPSNAATKVAEPLTALSLTEAARRLRAREVTSVALTRAYLDRIAIYNPKLNALITVMTESALAQASALDREAQKGAFRGPLHGVPIILKDNIDTAGTRTTAASEVFDERVPTEDAFVAAKLKAAGAVILAKANMHEFAMGHTSATSYFGPVRNPWALDRTPAGSSGGCGAAVISDLCAAAVGTDTGGSVRMPAAYCSMVGLKPTYGLVSIRGIVPLVYSIDHCGPMTHTVEDAALLLNSMVGYDADDVASLARPPEDYVRSLRETRVADLRLGIPRAPYFDRLDPEIAGAMEAAIGVLRSLTRSTRDVQLPPVPLSASALSAETELYHRPYLAHDARGYSLSIRRGLEGEQKALDDVADAPCADKVGDYIQASWDLTLARRRIDAAFTDFDLVALPTMRLPPPTINEALAREETPQPREPEIDNNCRFFDVFGIPAISVPCGFTRGGLPIGLMIAGPRFSEGRVLALAHAYEQATTWSQRRPALSADMTVPPIIRRG